MSLAIRSRTPTTSSSALPRTKVPRKRAASAKFTREGLNPEETGLEDIRCLLSFACQRRVSKPPWLSRLVLRHLGRTCRTFHDILSEMLSRSSDLSEELAADPLSEVLQDLRLSGVSY